jgi:hypothetical protein
VTIQFELAGAFVHPVGTMANVAAIFGIRETHGCRTFVEFLNPKACPDQISPNGRSK